MLLKHAISIVTTNSSLLFKVLIYMIVVSLIFGAFFYAIVKPIIAEVVEEVKSLSEFNPETDDIADFNSVGDVYRAVEAVYRNATDSIGANNDLFVKALLLLAALILIIKFLVTLTLMPISHVIYQKITQNYNAKFLNAVVATLAKSVKFSLLATAITVPADIAIFLGTALFIKLTLPVMGVLSLTVGLAIFIVLYSLRLSAFGQWVPGIICKNLSVTHALAGCFKTKPFFFARLFMSTLFIITVMVGIISATFIFTAGLIPIVSVVFTLIFLITANLIVACVEQKQNYYIDPLNIITTTAHNKEEKYEVDVNKTI